MAKIYRKKFDDSLNNNKVLRRVPFRTLSFLYKMLLSRFWYRG